MHKVKTNKTQMRFPIIFSILNTTEFNPLQILYQSEFNMMVYGSLYRVLFSEVLHSLKLIWRVELDFGFYICISNPTNLIYFIDKNRKEKKRWRGGGRRRKNLISALNKLLQCSASRVVMFWKGNVLDSVMSDNSISYRQLDSTVFTLAIVESARSLMRYARHR